MEESIITGIVDGDDEVTFSLIVEPHDKEVITIQVGDKKYRADWYGNLVPFFKKALELWEQEGGS